MTTPATPAPLPAEAVEAAIDDIAEALGKFWAPRPAASFMRRAAEAALEAAAPHLATAGIPRLIVQVEGGAITEAAWNQLGERIKAFRDQLVAEAVAAERERCAQLAEHLRSLLTSGPIGRASGERYIRADLIRAVLDQHDANLLRQDGST